jgi:uncharacterized repeat protein (TIGR02543 family)
MLKRLDEFRKDRGDGVLVTVIIAIPLFMLAFMFSVGMAQNAWTKTSLADAAQASAQTAAGKLNSSGYLDDKSVGTFVSEYMRLSNRSAFNTEQKAAGAVQTKDSAAFACSTVNVNGKELKSPYIEVTLDKSRSQGVSSQGSPLYTSIGGAGVAAVTPAADKGTYRVLSATVYEASRTLLGNGFLMVGENSGCFTNKAEVSGITFGANEDLAASKGDAGGPASCSATATPIDIPDKGMQTNGSIKLYTGPDASCPVSGFLTSAYVNVTDEYGSFYKITSNGKPYWVNKLDLRAAETCASRPTADLTTPISPIADFTTRDSAAIKTYSAPFTDCQATTSVKGAVKANARYAGASGEFMKLTTGPWVRASDVKGFRTVTFNPNGGSGGGAVNTYDGAKINAPAVPTRGGYAFAGWFPSASGGAPITFPVAVTGNTTYFAQWTVGNFNISYAGNGGAVTNCTPTSYSKSSATITPTAASCGTISRPGYTFTGFSPASIPTNSTGNKTFTAQWKANTYKITYDPRGGKIAAGATCGPATYTVNSAAIAPKCKPTRAGYDFINWTPSNIAKGSTGDKVFAAQWAAKG